MLAFGAPAFVIAAAIAASIVVVLHLLAWRRPVPTPLPTTRFIPDAPVRAVSRAVRLTDAALLALRVIALLAAGLALAQPRLANTPRSSARVVLADRSRAVASTTELRDSAASVSRGVDAVRLILFDSAATRSVASDSADLTPSESRGNLSAGLVMALREAERLTQDFAEVDIVLVSPVAREELDAATSRIRALWPGRIHLARLAARGTESELSPVAPTLPPVSDALGAASRLALARDSLVPVAGNIRVVRGVATAADSAAARAGALLVVWPDSLAGVALDVTLAGTVTTGRHTVIAPLLRVPNEEGGRAVAWWGDGTVAAAERELGEGCIRVLGFLPSAAGDLVLRPAFVKVVRDLFAPCGGADWRVVPASELSWLTEPAAPGNVASRGTGGANMERPSSTLPLVLLAVSLAALIAEWWLRRGRSGAVASSSKEQRRNREAA